MKPDNSGDNTNSIIRRQFERYRMDRSVEIRFDNKVSKTMTNLMDISMGGASICTVTEIAIDNSLLMCLDDSSSPFEGYGQVVWTKKSAGVLQTGIKFLYMTHASLSSLSKILIHERSNK